MSKSLICLNIQKAKMAHVNWVRRAGHLVEGIPVQAEFIPFDATECHFGQWFYDEVMKFNVIPELHDILADIENAHNRLHDIYRRIYKIYFVDTAPSWIRSLITNQRKKVTGEMRRTAEHYFKELQRHSDELMKSLDLFEAEVQVVTSEYFSELAS